jgi:hypothetical protein
LKTFSLGGKNGGAKQGKFFILSSASEWEDSEDIDMQSTSIEVKEQSLE